jgi:DNA-binding response OmpR family regulator
MVKPVRRSETIARVAALGRRLLGRGDVLECKPYTLDIVRHELRMHGQPVSLTDREFALASFLFRHAGRIVSRSHLLESVWGSGRSAQRTRTVDTHISRLRQKLRLDATDGWRLSSVYQHGYRLEEVHPDRPAQQASRAMRLERDEQWQQIGKE